MADPRSQQLRPQDILEYEDDGDNKSKMNKALKEYPLMFVGLAGAFAALTYSFTNIRKRDKRVPISTYLIHTRMAVQGTFVMSLILMTTWNIFKKKTDPKDKD